MFNYPRERTSPGEGRGSRQVLSERCNAFLVSHATREGDIPTSTQSTHPPAYFHKGPLTHSLTHSRLRPAPPHHLIPHSLLGLFSAFPAQSFGSWNLSQEAKHRKVPTYLVLTYSTDSMCSPIRTRSLTCYLSTGPCSQPDACQLCTSNQIKPRLLAHSPPFGVAMSRLGVAWEYRHRAERSACCFCFCFCFCVCFSLDLHRK